MSATRQEMSATNAKVKKDAFLIIFI